MTLRGSHVLVIAALAFPGLALSARPAAAQEKKDSVGEKIEKLVQKLGADDYKTREQAQKDLIALGRPALPALEKAAKESSDAEVRARAAEAATSIRKGLGMSQGQPAPEKEKERNGELEPDEPPITDPTPAVPQPKLDDVFKNVPKDLPQEILKMLERFQKQLDDMDKETPNNPGEEKELEIPGGRGKIRTWTFSNAPRAGKDPVEARLGIGLGPTTAALRAQLSLGPTEGGVVVNELVPGGWAEKSGIQLYDVIVAVDGRAVRTSADLASLIAKGAKVDVIRKSKLEKLDVAGATGQPAPAPGGEPKKDEQSPPLRKF